MQGADPRRAAGQGMAMHSTTIIRHQPHAQQGVWYNGQVAEERKKKQRAVVLVVIVSVASFVRRLLMLVLGLLRLSYRKVRVNCRRL